MQPRAMRRSCSDTRLFVRAASFSETSAKGRKASTLSTFFNLTKSFVGASSFELPWAFGQAGLWGGVAGILLLALLSNFTLRILAVCGHLARDHIERQPERMFSHKRHLASNPTYPEIGKIAFGRVGAGLCWFGVLAMTVGVCGSYLVFIGTATSRLVASYSTSSGLLAGVAAPGAVSWSPSPALCTFLVLPLLILLSWLRSYKFLAGTSIVGIGALFFALGVTMTDASAHSIAPLSSFPAVRWHTYPLFLGNAAFLYLIHSVVLPVEQSMEQPAEYGSALNVSMAFVTILNIGFAVMAYLCYGDSVQGNVIDNLRAGWVADLVRLLLAVDLLFTFALFMYPVSESFERVLFDESSFGQRRTELGRNAFRAFIVLLTAAVAVLIPHFSLITGLSGGFGNNLVGFILPPLLYLRLQHQRGYWNDLAPAGAAAAAAAADENGDTFGALIPPRRSQSEGQTKHKVGDGGGRGGGLASTESLLSLNGTAGSYGALEGGGDRSSAEAKSFQSSSDNATPARDQTRMARSHSLSDRRPQATGQLTAQQARVDTSDGSQRCDALVSCCGLQLRLSKFLELAACVGVTCFGLFMLVFSTRAFVQAVIES